MGTRFRYSAAMLDFLEAGYKSLPVPELTEAFNREFTQDKSVQQIKCCLSNHGFTCGRPTGTPKGQLRIFTLEQMDFIRENYGAMGRQAVTDAMNERFGTRFTYRQVTAFIKNHKLYSARTGHFEKGHVPANKGVKGWQAGGRSVETQFKKGSKPPNRKDLWHERICSKDGYILMKVPERNPYTGAPTRYMHKHIWVWKQANGPIPEGHVIVLLDGDKLNCSLENLRCVPRGVLQYMNKTGLNETTGDARKAAILVSETVTRAKQLERKRV